MKAIWLSAIAELGSSPLIVRFQAVRQSHGNGGYVDLATRAESAYLLSGRNAADRTPNED
jgi:hypothetical protein